jgi:hypothetical protein
VSSVFSKRVEDTAAAGRLLTAESPDDESAAGERREPEGKGRGGERDRPDPGVEGGGGNAREEDEEDEEQRPEGMPLGGASHSVIVGEPLVPLRNPSLRACP